jgi:hypothetical protein
MHPRMTPGEIVAIREGGRTTGYARIKSTLEQRFSGGSLLDGSQHDRPGAATK